MKGGAAGSCGGHIDIHRIVVNIHGSGIGAHITGYTSYYLGRAGRCNTM